MFADKLKTQRLVLRSPVDGDAPRLVEVLNNWNVVKNLALVPWPYEAAHAEEFLVACQARKASSDCADYSVTMDGQLLGIISVAPRSTEPNLGYWLGEPYWGLGIMTEAVEAVVAAFFWAPENQMLTSGVFVGNDASLAVQRKFGFEVVGQSAVMCRARGAEVPHFDTMLTRKTLKSRSHEVS